MKNNDANLPDGWIKATISVLADYVNGRAFKPTEWKDTGKPIIRIQNLNNGSAKYNFSPENHEEKYLVKNGDLLFAWSASLGAYIWHGGDAWLNQHIFLVHPKDCTTKLFVFYLLEKITTELYAKAHGSGMVHVTKGKFESTEISLPPLLEQHRIVAKIEELFSELDKGIENLKTAQAQLKVYRQALLKHAFEGKLTAQWRAQRHAKQSVAPAQAGAQPFNDMDSRPTFSRGLALRGNDEAGSGNDKPLETAEALLKRIQQEREQRYQQQLAEWEKSPSVPLLQRGKPTSTAPIPPLRKRGARGDFKTQTSENPAATHRRRTDRIA
ncbi:restriction endonuclease subunit S [Nitrosomonas ureae]|uniref:Type I restriction modification DNA specificity domain-containing protein n=1 Tax=Nitrosomonas ureae TaxID=44577 RepID=A0A286A323_9PROT|nr:restriction endonuclease subunit S [Nitrosomonas ureae]SOD16306.1 Type I restriction modification DNA specificity domain-containing protein [Nitrosomonas ureae]